MTKNSENETKSVGGLRHPDVAEILCHFRYEHLPPHLQDVSKPLCETAERLANTLSGPELTVGLRKLLEAKDCFVRAALRR